MTIGTLQYVVVKVNMRENDAQKPCEPGEAVFASQMLYFVLKGSVSRDFFGSFFGMYGYI
jgi:hypothetical protein